MNAVDFEEFVLTARRGRSLMARIALNSLGYQNFFPVDISELRGLCPENRAMVNAFLDWKFSNEDYRCWKGGVDLLAAAVQSKDRIKWDLAQGSQPPVGGQTSVAGHRQAVRPRHKRGKVECTAAHSGRGVLGADP